MRKLYTENLRVRRDDLEKAEAKWRELLGDEAQAEAELKEANSDLLAAKRILPSQVPVYGRVVETKQACFKAALAAREAYEDAEFNEDLQNEISDLRDMEAYLKQDMLLVHGEDFTEYCEEHYAAELPANLPEWLTVNWESSADNIARADWHEVTCQGEVYLARLLSGLHLGEG